MRVLSILVRHGLARYAGALTDLQAFHRSRLPSARCDLLVVDNAGEAPTRSGAVEAIPGSNRAWEFSGWDEGLAHVGGRIREYDVVHLVTSAFRALYTGYLDRCDERTLALVADRRAALGHIDYYDEAVELLGRRSQSWLRTAFFFLPPSELERLGPLAGVPDRAAFFSGDPASPFRRDAPLSENYRRYVLGWLTGAGTGQGTTWHSRFTLTADTLPLFEAKALAMFNEQLLAIRLRQQGCDLVDAIWLSTRARRRWRWRPLRVPHWSEQLAGRDTDRISVEGAL
jgi:hypothetical protein